MSEQRGAFIAFEGGDGAGKSTQVHLLADRLRDLGLTPLLTRQPGGTALGRALREIVLHGEAMSARAEALIFAADKAQHVEEVIRPGLAQGRVVISDRYTDSSVAYQGAGRELGAAEVQTLQMWAVDGLVPDLTVIVDITAEEGRRRRGEVHDRLEAEEDRFHEAVREHFHALASSSPQRYLVVDGGAPADEIAARVWERVADLLEGVAVR